MEDLPVGAEVTLKVVEAYNCEAVSLVMMTHAITRPIMVGVMDSSVNQKNVLMVKM